MKRRAAPRNAAASLAGGRQIPRLLFVTSRAGLAANIGAPAAARALAMLRDAGPAVLSTRRAGLSHPGSAHRMVARALTRHRDVHGIVILGGYDVVPSQRLDCLPPRLRAVITGIQDPGDHDYDDYIVWSDDVYGDPEGHGVPRFPVSRIPDGRAASVFFAALAAPPAPRETRRGLRSKMRPFADRVFATLPGSGRMRRSSPTASAQLPHSALRGAHVYLILHGLPDKGGIFGGESSSHERMLAMTVKHAPGAGAVVLAGCCWGGLVARRTAHLDKKGVPPPARTARGSIAVTALSKGARAFVGSTGENWSPTQTPYGYFATPLHRAFWRSFLAGAPPAKALLEAKHAFALGMPHGCARDTQDEAIEFKTVRQYTCLGLGW